jgi:hypothetical protein
MSDVVDTANDQAQHILDKQIAIARGKPLNVFPNESNLCWECEAKVDDGRRWCSKECADRSDK